MDEEHSVLVGIITTTFGRKGEVKVQPLTDFPERFETMESAYVARERMPGRLMPIESARLHKGAVVLKFEGIDNITAAEALRDFEIRIRESELIPLEEDEYYVSDIIGLEVVTDNGESLGNIREILRSPGNDVYVTERAMIPAVKEFVLSIDLGGGRMVVKAIEGLVQE